MTSERRRRLRRTCGLILGGAFVIGNPQCGPPAADHLHLALAWLEAGRQEQALLEVRRAARQDGPSVDGTLVAAYAHVDLDQPDRALETVLDGVVRWPADARLHRFLRELCEQTSQYGAARQRLEPLAARQAAADGAPPVPVLAATVGWLRAATGDDEGAAALLRQAAAAPDSDSFASLELARVLDRLDRPAAARQVLEDALLVLPDDPGVLLAAGAARLREGDLPQAAQAFERLLATAPLPRREAIRAAMASYEAGAADWAVGYYERALALGDPGPLSHNNLAWIYAELGRNLDRALALATAAVKMEPDNAVYLDTYAEVYFRRGQADRAVAIARQALQAEPEGGEHREHLERQLERFTAKLRADAHPSAPTPRLR